MSNYDIYGIGNALVDFDFEVTDETLTNLNIEKSVMTLIDETQEQRLMEELVGVKHVKACGGSAANTIITARQLGSQCFYSCKVACDPTGDFFYEDLTREGVETNLTQKGRSLGSTGKCVAMITPDAERTMNTFLGITASLSTAEVISDAISQSKVLYIEGYLVASDTAFEAAKLAKKVAQDKGVKIVTGLSDINMVRYFKPQLLEIIGDDCDVLFSNEQEALLFTETESLDDAATKLAEYARQVVITLGDKGAMIIEGESRVTVETQKVVAVDTIGAGDAFAGAYLAATNQGFAAEIAAKIACFTAAEVVTKFGPRLSDTQVSKVREMISSFRREKAAG